MTTSPSEAQTVHRTLTERDWNAVESTYLRSSSTPHVVVDNFLAPDAFDGLYADMLGNPAWDFGPGCQSCYARAPSRECIEAIVSEIFERMPRVLDGLEFVEHWAFMHRHCTGLRPHFDVGSVTVNLWLTEDCHNLTPGRSGLVLYPLKRPSVIAKEERTPGWSDRYFDQHHDGSEVLIPYRSNRAIVFDSALYHASDIGDFTGAEPQSSRLNIAILFDQRCLYEATRERFG